MQLLTTILHKKSLATAIQQKLLERRIKKANGSHLANHDGCKRDADAQGTPFLNSLCDLPGDKERLSDAMSFKPPKHKYRTQQ